MLLPDYGHSFLELTSDEITKLFNIIRLNNLSENDIDSVTIENDKIIHIILKKEIKILSKPFCGVFDKTKPIIRKYKFFPDDEEDYYI